MPTSKHEAENPEGIDDEPATGNAEPTERPQATRPARAKEIGGPEGPEPTRYGDWERNGRCTDF